MEVRLPLSHSDWEVGALSFLMIQFHRNSPQCLRNTLLGYTSGKRLLKGFISQKDGERISNYEFSKVNGIRKRSAESRVRKKLSKV
jgi:hypothetical protein